MNEGVKPIPLDKLLDNLYFKMEVESFCRMHSSEHLKILASTIYYLEELKNGSKRNGKVSKRNKRQGDGDSSGSEGEG